MFSGELENPNPTVYEVAQLKRDDLSLEDEDSIDPFDALEIFEMIRTINDPEHPFTLEQLNVAQRDLIKIDNENNSIFVNFTPTIPHCSMSTLIGLSIRVKLLRSLPKRFKVDVKVTPGSHASELQVNKQLNDKERVAAALENQSLLQVVERCIRPK
eukprot:TRINITY_DN20378_c0_g1::TRINITY_DN20378_c0_g1_i1::g.8479::m.8479 TRINITY_DN20378_c0_g1::TRINITY_DN20378_c0_g1_i1::g.8479  ORF type:complete len:157 (+),score=21.19,sp/Q9VTC4/U195A_DROME/64.47/6e-64,DUF59/PF01883.14/1.3e-10,DUF59/PF01883.14/8.9e+03,DUF3341/PF11821.3/0.0055 TRINITY_DN20378_c0_g1_i1:66-536(+)